MLLLWLVFALGSLERGIPAYINDHTPATGEANGCRGERQNITLGIFSRHLPNEKENGHTLPNFTNDTGPGPKLLNSTSVRYTDEEVTVQASMMGTGSGQQFVCEMSGFCGIPPLNAMSCSKYSIECTLRPLRNCQICPEVPINPPPFSVYRLQPTNRGVQRSLEFRVSCCNNTTDNCSTICLCRTIFVEGGYTKASASESLPGFSPSASLSKTSEASKSPSTIVPTKMSTNETKGVPPSTTSETTTGTAEATSGNYTVVIVGSVIGCLIVLILVAILVLQLIRVFRKRKYRHHFLGGTGERFSTTLSNDLYTQRPALAGEATPYECPAESGAKNFPLHPQQPSPYETATGTNGVYSLLTPPDEKLSSDGGNRTDATDEQHIYEDADRYVSSPMSCLSNADYEVAAKSIKGPNKRNPQPRTDDDDYADPDDARFDDEKYETRPIKSAGGEKGRAPNDTQYQHSDDDYSAPYDAISKETDTQGSDKDILNPLYHELGKNKKPAQPTDDDFKTGGTKEKVVTLESTMYEPAVLAPVSSTAQPDLERNTNTASHVETENTSPSKRAREYTSSDQGTQENTPSSTDPRDSGGN